MSRHDGIEGVCHITVFRFYGICISYESMSNSVIFLQLSVKKLKFQVSNCVFMELLKMHTEKLI
jgi:hypothetical protein